MFGNKKDKRFEVIHSESESGFGRHRIIRDKETGVNYLFTSEGYAGGLTVLLNKDGKPVITSEEDEYREI